VGILLPNLLNHSLNKEMAILLFALFMSFVTFIKGIGVAEKINNILTLIMMISFSSIVAAALDPSAGFDINRLFNRSNFNSLLPFNAQSSMSWAIPYFLQLLVYTETIPLVVSRLNKKDDITKSILLGSLIPLLMCIIWTAVSIGLIPYDYVSSSLTIDPVDFLLKSSTSKSIKNSILILTLSAISTTVIGSCLTISQFLNDILKGNKGLSRILSILPASLISAFGSKSLYYAATHFAGAFPVTLLWGLFPPLAFLKSSSSSSSSSSISNVKKLGQYVLILLSLLMLVINVINIS
jgi:tyrosine-specific transport protein